MDTLTQPEFQPTSLHHHTTSMRSFAGVCPTCLHEPPYMIDVRKDHWAVCPKDKVTWWVGSNLLTTYWRMDDADLLALFGTTDRERLVAEAVGILDGYQQVEPVLPGHATATARR